MTPLQLIMAGVAIATVIGFGFLWVGLPAYVLWRWGRPEGLADTPRWKLAIALPYIGMVLVFCALAVADAEREVAADA